MIVDYLPSHDGDSAPLHTLLLIVVVVDPIGVVVGGI
jgi:hypothetical protein